MVQATTLPTRPSPSSSTEQKVETVWEMLLYFIKNIYDYFVAGFANNMATVPNGATTVVVTHSLGRPAYTTSLSPTVDPGGRYWVSNKTPTQFTINLQVAAPGGGIPFDWMVKAI